ncbi:MAG: glycosyltransferase family 4 protein, partial [Candidatus Thorarchaeota archaeon]|nr:glycosyltransferase family 4 protein [Candidatus Thorarchaeota archaeon]
YHVHSYLYTLSFQAVLTKMFSKKNMLLQLHGGLGMPPYSLGISKTIVKYIYDRTIGAFIIKNSDLVASVSRKDLHYVASRYSLDESRLRYVPNSVDTKIFAPKKEPRSEVRKVILFIGDLEPWKGIGIITEWFQNALKSNTSPLTFRFVGQGSLTQDLIRYRDLFRLKDNGIRIEVLGQRTHDVIPRLMEHADALLLPSYWEGFPTVVLEAMAAGIPVISTPVGDVPNLVTNGQEGIIIDYSRDSLDNALERVLCNDRELVRMTHKARRKVVNYYSIKHVIKTLYDVYQEVHAK